MGYKKKQVLIARANACPRMRSIGANITIKIYTLKAKEAKRLFVYGEDGEDQDHVINHFNAHTD